MGQNMQMLLHMPRAVPLEHVSFEESLLAELKSLGLVKAHRHCVHILKVNHHLEVILRDRVKRTIKPAFFQYGQLLFLNERYIDAAYYFNRGCIEFKDLQCAFQMGIMYYDGLDCEIDPELGCTYMKLILEKKDLAEAQHLMYAAAYNLGRAYYMGIGVVQSNEKALQLWIFAADDGSPLASVQAQTMLGFYYSSPDHLDIEKAFFWHSEACGNGSLESQGVLGVMYFLGIGKKVDYEAALVCLRNASERGDIYARGMLCYFFYSRKLFTNAANLSSQMIISSPDPRNELSDSNRKGYAIATFIYGRCLNFGLGVQQNFCVSQTLNKKSYSWNADVTIHFRRLVSLGEL